MGIMQKNEQATSQASGDILKRFKPCDNVIQIEIDSQRFKQLLATRKLCVDDVRCINTKSKDTVKHLLIELLTA